MGRKKRRCYRRELHCRRWRWSGRPCRLESSRRRTASTASTASTSSNDAAAASRRGHLSRFEQHTSSLSSLAAAALFLFRMVIAEAFFRAVREVERPGMTGIFIGHAQPNRRSWSGCFFDGLNVSGRKWPGRKTVFPARKNRPG
jgi:hypothetical protein